MPELVKLQKLAELLHTKLCRFSPMQHEDRCGWDYESWEQPGWTRKRYLARARKLLAESGVDIDIVIKVIEAL